jgi:L-malate glycosyltransferase
MKICHAVEYYYPSTGGAQEAVKQLSERLVKRGHEVTVVTKYLPYRKDLVQNGVKIIQFDISGNPVKGYVGEIDGFRNILLKSDFDVILFYAAQQWTTDLAIPILNKINSIKILAPCGFSGLYDKRFESYFQNFSNILNNFDAFVFFSKAYRDYGYFIDKTSKPIYVIPNGADENEFENLNKDHLKNIKVTDQIFNIVLIGNHTKLKGHREAITLFKISNIKNANLYIIGKKNKLSLCFISCKTIEFLNKINIMNNSNKKIKIIDCTREEVIKFLNDADLFLFPSQIECSPIVLFESMASKTPFFSTDVGNASEIADLSQGGLILPTVIKPNGLSYPLMIESKKIIEYYYNNRKLLFDMGERGYDYWIKNCTWDIIASKYEKVYMELVYKLI